MTETLNDGPAIAGRIGDPSTADQLEVARLRRQVRRLKRKLRRLRPAPLTPAPYLRPTDTAVLQALQEGGPLKPEAVLERAGYSDSRVRESLTRLWHGSPRLLEKVGKVYQLTPAGLAAAIAAAKEEAAERRKDGTA